MGITTTGLLTAWHVAAVVLFVLILRTAILRKRRDPMPPGPAGWPIIGNAFDVPVNYQWKTFAKWGERWGDLVSIVLLGQPLVIINSYKHAYELLEKRSAIYSDRPHMIMAGDIVGWDQILVLLRYGSQFREYRRLMARALGSRKNVEAFVPIVEEQTGKLLGRLLREPASDLPSQIRKMTGAIVLMISYGYQAQENDDPLIRIAEEATEQAAEVAQPGAFLVDVFPFLKHMPTWMPGAGWKRKGQMYRANMDQMSAVPHQFVKDQMAAGASLPSFTSTMLAGNPSPDEEYRIKMSAASIYSGGADTTVSAELTFILAMGLWPAVQKKAQEELDAVVGRDRLPTYADIARMPYLNAIYLETLRWNQVVPLGVAHAILEDDFYEGYFIPKGSIVCVNQWRILHDPEIYADPFTFNPERFLRGPGKEPELDPRKVAFGFGRRICPGLHLAELSVLVVAASLLSAFNIAKPLNEDGVRITPETAEHTGGVISHPAPFTCTIEPRSDKARALILALQEHK
ncbi:cytochrome P450 [Ganoderma leucocontextum]|nr:cytochrome P450 [Ganoderma leucocontextum]